MIFGVECYKSGNGLFQSMFLNKIKEIHDTDLGGMRVIHAKDLVGGDSICKRIKTGKYGTHIEHQINGETLLVSKFE